MGYQLTKIDLAALRKCDRLYIGIRQEKMNGDMHQVPCVHAIKNAVKDEANPFAQDVYHVIPAPVTFHWENQVDSTQGQAHGHIYMYRSCSDQDHGAAVLNTLRVGDEIAFEFYPDAGSNGYCAERNMHVDELRLHVRRGDKRIACWILNQATRHRDRSLTIAPRAASVARRQWPGGC